MKEDHEGAGARRGGRLGRRLIWVLVALPLALAAYVAVLYPQTPSIGDIRKASREEPSVVLSADGKQLAVFRRANRDWVKLSEISPKVTDALLSTEDKRFYHHHGIDVARTARAVLNTLTGDVEGGSTITQQLARNLYPEEIGREQTITRKIKEAITALKIESVYSKDEILETYLNSVSFLYNAWGIEMAARTYFGKSARDLDELEAATLVGMLKGTAYYNPVLNPERARERRNTVLALMVKEGHLDPARYERLKAQPLKLDFDRQEDNTGPAPHLADWLKRWLLDWAERHDYNIYADGLVVRTSIDSRLQDMANRAVERQTQALQAVADVEWSKKQLSLLGRDTDPYVAQDRHVAAFDYFWDSHPQLLRSWMEDTQDYKKAREQGQSEEEALAALRGDADFMRDLKKRWTMLQAGFLAIDPATGAIRAWVGSRDYRADKFDHVQQARRQPGSTFKPFVYGAAFEMGHQPNETLMDQPVAIQVDRNQVWRPGDVEGAPSNEPMTLRDALAKSKNTITAQLMMQVGPARVASLARAMGVRQSKLDEVPSLALGTSPVTLKEMVSAFATIAAGGTYHEPYVVTAVEDHNHNVLERFGSGSSGQALSSDAADMLLDVLRGTVDYGTAAGLRPRFGLTGDLAGKTGTTQDNTDGWFILMQPQLVAGAWVGFNDNRVSLRSSYWGQGAHNALFVVGDMMRQAEKAGLIDAKATFAAPHLRELEQEKPLVDRMGDWWNSVFNSTASGDATVATVPQVPLPELRLEPPQLEPPPAALEPSAAAPTSSASAAAADARAGSGLAAAGGRPGAAGPTGSFDAPGGSRSAKAANASSGSSVSSSATVAAKPDAAAASPPALASRPQRVPSFPRPLEPARPVETIPGTQVYRSPEATARWPEPAEQPVAAGRAPGPVRDTAPERSVPAAPATQPTAAMGAPARLPRDGLITPPLPDESTDGAPAAPVPRVVPWNGGISDASGNPTALASP